VAYERITLLPPMLVDMSVSHRFLSVFAVDVEQLTDSSFIDFLGWSDLLVDAAESLGKRIADARETFSANADIVFKAPVMGCCFELFERLDAQFFMEAPGKGLSDPW